MLGWICQVKPKHNINKQIQHVHCTHIVWRKNNIHIARCRLVGETDSEGRATGEGSLTYTNGDRFEVIVFSFSSLV